MSEDTSLASVAKEAIEVGGSARAVALAAVALALEGLDVPLAAFNVGVSQLKALQSAIQQAIETDSAES